ncbi:uncharacterized protein LOC114366668 [Ostrinia furnacalis]|uniref:uncharacterized protein LOC114366668 n=1 Tax=Ostrinia furnacalis TaxID=93504 RepID=UPI001038CEC6|nr:uncharacterized protein LOC114366668 [Ostrinia furnacalis]
MKFSIACLLLASLHVGFAYKILVVFPMPGKSHTILGEGVVRHLANAQHDVTYITPIFLKSPPKNVRQIDVTSNFDFMKNNGMLIIHIAK